MAVKRSALGKGLGALIKENTTVETKNSVIEVDINKIEPGVGQPRKNFDKEKIELEKLNDSPLELYVTRDFGLIKKFTKKLLND